MNAALMLGLMFACGEEAPKKEKTEAPKVEVKKETPKVEAKQEAPKEESPKTDDAKPEGEAEAKVEEKPAAAPVAAARTGEQVFQQVCTSCHQATGQGIAGVYPPLAGSDWMSKSSETLIKIVLHGLMGEIEVNGTKYNQAMSPWGGSLNDEEVANVLTYVRSSWGNTGDAVKPEEVKTVRETFKGHAPWTAAELN